MHYHPKRRRWELQKAPNLRPLVHPLAKGLDSVTARCPRHQRRKPVMPIVQNDRVQARDSCLQQISASEVRLSLAVRLYTIV